MAVCLHNESESILLHMGKLWFAIFREGLLYGIQLYEYYHKPKQPYNVVDFHILILCSA